MIEVLYGSEGGVWQAWGQAYVGSIVEKQNNVNNVKHESCMISITSAIQLGHIKSEVSMTPFLLILHWVGILRVVWPQTRLPFLKQNDR